MQTPAFYRPSVSDYPEIVALWEASVRATHHFLSEDDIRLYRSLILYQYLDAVELYCVTRKDKIAGFMGLSEGMVQMLFIHPDERGSGIGKLLLNYAIKEKQATMVDVNEQNQQAVDFYTHMGFKVKSRSDTDGAGKPYPILSMVLADG